MTLVPVMITVLKIIAERTENASPFLQSDTDLDGSGFIASSRAWGVQPSPAQSGAVFYDQSNRRRFTSRFSASH